MIDVPTERDPAGMPAGARFGLGREGAATVAEELVPGDDVSAFPASAFFPYTHSLGTESGSFGMDPPGPYIVWCLVRIAATASPGDERGQSGWRK